MPCRAICSATRLKINLGNKRRYKRLDPREAHEHAIERAGHTGRPRPLPGIGSQRRLDEGRHRRSLNTLAGYITQNHDSAVVGKTNKRVEVAADQRRIRCR